LKYQVVSLCIIISRKGSTLLVNSSLDIVYCSTTLFNHDIIRFVRLVSKINGAVMEWVSSISNSLLNILGILDFGQKCWKYPSNSLVTTWEKPASSAQIYRCGLAWHQHFPPGVKVEKEIKNKKTSWCKCIGEKE
jgi:hypothetical protein